MVAPGAALAVRWLSDLLLRLRQESPKITVSKKESYDGCRSSWLEDGATRMQLCAGLFRDGRGTREITDRTGATRRSTAAELRSVADQRTPTARSEFS